LDGILHQSVSLWPCDLRDLVGFVRPILDLSILQKNPSLFNSILKNQNQNVSIDDVINNLHNLIYIRKEVNLNVLNKIYDFFWTFSNKDQLKSKLKQRGIDHVYDGVDSYRSTSTFILKSRINDLSPFYFVPSEDNQFVNRFKQLYTSAVFDCLPELTQNVLVDLINNKISKTDNLMISNFNLVNQIRSIYTLIEQSYDSNASMSLLLPVYDAKNSELIKFESAENCVYLNDDLDDKQDEQLEYKMQRCLEKNMRVCNDDKLISRKFLKKIGIKSFTECVMNIESLGVVAYGQHEDLTDRLKTLLNGYKDGLSLFKEIIQV
jgi:hypothetical protein